MKRTFLLLTAAFTLAAATATTNVASAVGAPVDRENGSIIWSGLWAGANFDFSSLGWPVEKVQPTPPPSVPDVPPPRFNNSAPSNTFTPSTTQNKFIYAALGDSVSAGLGLPVVATPAGNDTRCGRSPQSYAYTVASTMNLPLKHLACSGATAGDLFTRQGVRGPNITAQLDSAFATGKPHLITITAGANDAHWDEFIRGCYAASCANNTTTLLANTYLVALQTKLHIALQSINARSGGSPPTTVVTGYYNPLSMSCTQLQSSVTENEITWLNGEANALNQTVQNVARHYSFVRFAPVDFTGHDICSTDSWVQRPGDPAPFHPTAAGQQVIAQSILQVLAK